MRSCFSSSLVFLVVLVTAFRRRLSASARTLQQIIELAGPRKMRLMQIELNPGKING